MDATTKLFIFMLLVSLTIGGVVLLTMPEYRIKNIYQTNKNYYPQINDENVKKDLQKLLSKNGFTK
ncbi:MAG: hypothetical protein NZ928_02145 [Endomicrobia bacterium]|nr:hypothetical protein [Endomicrobiia bacterium]MCX7940281.1 hypothetical protein [Endomicrobiia bacterium]MDW8055815.1 hypothetical protein [Elusimicrobiota bacterium]